MVGTVSRSVLSWSDRKTTEAWWLQKRGWLLFDHPDGGVMLTANPQMHLLWRPGAEMFSWVGHQTFVKEISYNGKSCRYYRRESPRPSGDPLIDSEAWIASETSLPVALRHGATIYTFTFNPPPASAPVLPERFQKELSRAETAMLPPGAAAKSRSWTKN